MQILKTVLQSKYYLFCLFLLIIFIAYYRINLNKKSIFKGNEQLFEFKVIEKKYKNNQYSVILFNKEKVIFYCSEFPYDVGDIILVKGSITKPKNNTIPNTFNYYKYLQSRNITWELKSKEISLIKRNSNIINKIKKIIVNKIDNNKYREYLYAFLLGDSSYFKEDKRNLYEKSGLSYLISIGSLQVMILVTLLKKIEGKIKIKKSKSLIINIIFIILYILFTNRIIGVLRSGLCFILSNILKYYKIKYKYHNIILIIGIILLIINPFYIINSGFLYSFTISLMISLYRKIIMGNYFRKLFIISVIAFISSLPISIFFNYEINFLTILYGFLFVPIFNFVVFPLSIIVFIFSFLSPVYYFIISFIEFIINILVKIDFFVLVFKKPSMIVIILYYFIIFIMFYKKKFILIFLLLVVIHHNINSIIKDKIVTFIDVGQGDAIIIQNNNHLFLLDTGGNVFSSHTDAIIHYIKSLGFEEIKTLIISHGDFDHMGDAINLVNNFKVEKVIFNCGPYNDLEQELINVLDKKHIKYYSCIKELNIDNNKLSFLQTKEYDNENDNSNVIYTELNGYKFMFMGDASVTTEKEILEKYKLPDIDVLKVGHHGSKTSSSKEFIDEIEPKYSVISVGKNNRYGHPNKEVLNNLEDSKIYRTDEDGSIMFKIKNNKLQIETYSP